MRMTRMSIACSLRRRMRRVLLCTRGILVDACVVWLVWEAAWLPATSGLALGGPCMRASVARNTRVAKVREFGASPQGQGCAW